MAEFVRVCPKCKHINPEYENLCLACGQFIGMETARPKPAAPASKPPSPAPTAPPQATRRFTPGSESFYLEAVDGGQVFTVQNGWIMGQAHADSPARIQLSAEFKGSEYLHRQHCRFDCRDGQWQVTALDQKAFGRDFTNPTFVNQRPVAPNTRHPLKNGDKLTLSGVVFLVKIL
jgi:hypothetical protein